MNANEDLIYAIEGENNKLVKLLIEKGADLNKEFTYKDDDYTPLGYANIHLGEDSEIVKLLKSKGAKTKVDNKQ